MSETTFMGALRDAGLIKSLGARGGRVAEFAALIDEFAEFSKNHSVYELIEYIIGKTGFMDDLKISDDNPEERAENIKELLSKAAEFDKSFETPDLSGFLEDVSLIADVDGYSETNDLVTLMTLHSAKGLEFDCVFLAGFEEGIFPSYRAVSSESKDAMEEERRLCYVGITRAKKDLYITAADYRTRAGLPVRNEVSRFLNEIPDEIIKRV